MKKKAFLQMASTIRSFRVRERSAAQKVRISTKAKENRASEEKFLEFHKADKKRKYMGNVQDVVAKSKRF